MLRPYIRAMIHSLHLCTHSTSSACSLSVANWSQFSFPPFLLRIIVGPQVEIYIALRYSCSMAKEITTAEYQALAELRYRIRKFVGEGDAVARAAGLEPQQYLLLLAIRGLPEGVEATIRTLADRLALKHHSAVELIDRLEAHGYVRRSRSRDDRRSVFVALLPRGEKLLEQVARDRIGELRASGTAFVNAISALLEDGGSSRTRKRAASSSKRGLVRKSA
jgi:DNA-binding MarR family transcriptional regulator